MSNSNTDIISRKIVLFQSEILELKKKISDFLTEKTQLEKEINSLRENMEEEVRQENTDLQEIVYDFNKENNQLKSKLEQMASAVLLIEASSVNQTENEVVSAQDFQVPDPLEQKRREAELEKQLFEYERNSTIPDFIRFEADENNFDNGDQ